MNLSANFLLFFFLFFKLLHSLQLKCPTTLFLAHNAALLYILLPFDSSDELRREAP